MIMLRNRKLHLWATNAQCCNDHHWVKVYICKQATEGPNNWNNPSKSVLPHEILKVEQLLPGPFGETGNSCQDYRSLQKCSVWYITFWSSILSDGFSSHSFSGDWTLSHLNLW